MHQTNIKLFHATCLIREIKMAVYISCRFPAILYNEDICECIYCYQRLFLLDIIYNHYSWRLCRVTTVKSLLVLYHSVFCIYLKVSGPL